eukprot:scaffold255426_cov81-Attheya_sp.AAC.1
MGLVSTLDLPPTYTTGSTTYYHWHQLPLQEPVSPACASRGYYQGILGAMPGAGHLPLSR